MRGAYYNEIDPYAAQWLRNLIAAGHIAPGEVDERSIVDVRPADLHGFAQCHFFAGIGVWSYALRRAGWPDDRPVWTGSCPCQPFSAAGKGAGFADERHLWPSWFWLIEQCRPPVVFGEQVASKDAEPWIDLVQDDLEAVGYGVGAVPFPSAGVGAPHIRDRLYWVADDDARLARYDARGRLATGREGHDAQRGFTTGGLDGRMELADDARSQGRFERGHGPEQRLAGTGGVAGGLADAQGGSEPYEPERAQPGQQSGPTLFVGVHDGADSRTGGRADPTRDRADRPIGEGPNGSGSAVERPGPTNGLWRDADWLLCRDGKWRPVEPGTFPLAHGAPARMGRLRGYGNAINAEAARTFIEAYLG